jgi:hypothetical protein
MSYAGFSDKEFSRALFAGLARRADMENCGFSMYKKRLFMSTAYRGF